MHIAAQYLAAAGKSFLDKKSDDSHTNLEWNSELRALLTRPLSGKNIRLSLNYDSFSLTWLDEELQPIANFTLSESSHKDAIEWLEQSCKEVGLAKPYIFDLHYELPYKDFNDRYQFPEMDEEAQDVLTENRDLVQEALEEILGKEKSGDIRIWPHHFDTGALLGESESNSIGIGMALPDSVADYFYLYISGYNEKGALDTSNFKPVDHGTWMSPKWHGGIANAEELSFIDMVEFFKSGISEVRKNF